MGEDGAFRLIVMWGEVHFLTNLGLTFFYLSIHAGYHFRVAFVSFDNFCQASKIIFLLIYREIVILLRQTFC